MTRVVIGRPCIECGRRVTGGRSRCSSCEPIVEADRQSRQLYRAAYRSSEYRAARRIRIRRAGGRCERILPDGTRCPARATEAHHTLPLAQARSIAEAIAWCRWELLEAVCPSHNPRGGTT